MDLLQENVLKTKFCSSWLYKRKEKFRKLHSIFSKPLQGHFILFFVNVAIYCFDLKKTISNTEYASQDTYASPNLKTIIIVIHYQSLTINYRYLPSLIWKIIPSHSISAIVTSYHSLQIIVGHHSVSIIAFFRNHSTSIITVTITWIPMTIVAITQ